MPVVSESLSLVYTTHDTNPPIMVEDVLRNVSRR